jgi:hypothetical protein
VRISLLLLAPLVVGALSVSSAAMAAERPAQRPGPPAAEGDAGAGAHDAGKPQATRSSAQRRLGPTRSRFRGVVRRPIDPAQQTDLNFGDRSHWLQPWRAYLDTPPATRLRDAIGINIDNQVAVEEIEPLARLLGESGFRRARYEIGWDQIDPDDPGRLRDPARVRRMVAALGDQGLRPLILLNANHNIPGPARGLDLRLTAPAPAGARTVHLDPTSAAAVVPGRSGFNRLSGPKLAEVLITRMEGTLAHLSSPLPRALPAGGHSGATLHFEPFGSPRSAGGGPNPAFERTMAGWLAYVGTVTREVRDVLGTDDFDVEIWNEPTFGSDFLYRNRYYDPDPEPEPDDGDVDVERTIVERTVAYLRDPAHGVPRVGIGNGFESQRPWASGTGSVPGLTAIDKHPYKNARRFPADAVNDGAGIRPLDARGKPSGRRPADDRVERWRDRFVPRYRAFFPEYYLSAIQTEHLVRDLSPITTDLYDTPHGRRTRPPGGGPAPQMWVTEWNLDATGADLSDPAGSGTGRMARLATRDLAHLRAKAALRFLTAYVNKGAAAVHLYAAKHPSLNLVDEGFFDAVKDGGGYPGAAAGGETMAAVGRLADGLSRARRVSRPRKLTLKAIGDYAGRRQFGGDGTAAHPPLYDRDVLAFLPFQLNSRSFVVPVYVMTRDMARVHRPRSRGPARFDLPQSRYRLTIGGVRTSRPVRVSASDPLTGRSVPVRTVSARGNRLVVELLVTDSPRLLHIREAGATP